MESHFAKFIAHQSYLLCSICSDMHAIIISVKLQAFGFLTAFALIALIVLIWIKFCLEKRQNSA